VPVRPEGCGATPLAPSSVQSAAGTPGGGEGEGRRVAPPPLGVTPWGGRIADVRTRCPACPAVPQPLLNRGNALGARDTSRAGPVPRVPLESQWHLVSEPPPPDGGRTLGPPRVTAPFHPVDWASFWTQLWTQGSERVRT
jgi:hypothetical protein